MLLGDQGGELVFMVLQQLLILEHVANTLRDGRLGPGRESIFGIRHGRVELVLRREWHLGDNVLGERALDIEALGSP